MQTLNVLRKILDFNSIKVRLKLKNVSENYLPNVFQFHKGTIKTSYTFCQ